jgi:hypothetical protein
MSKNYLFNINLGVDLGVFNLKGLGMFSIDDVKDLDIDTARKIGRALEVDRYCLDRASEETDQMIAEEYWYPQHIRAVQIAMLEDLGVLKKG